jgi:glycosyltransferase involved in cell wall biosynthesis
MKLVIQIPCYNEEDTLPITLNELPRQIEGITEIAVLVIDDGCSDRTVEIAREWSLANKVPLTIAHHIRNRGLAAAYQTGLNTALSMDADIIVNTDADNQYPGTYIPELVRPILLKQADMVIADRQTHLIEHFSPTKKLFQKWGSLAVRIFSNSKVPDAPSGFRAITRETALTLNVVTRYTYTVETIFQASKRNLTITSIPVFTNKNLRQSRLIKNVWSYMKRMAGTILRLYAMHEPLKAFFYFSLLFFLPGAFFVGRFVILSIIEKGNTQGRYLQSVTIGSVFLVIGFLIIMIGLIADLIGNNRRLIEDSLFRLKKIELEVDKQRQREEVLLDEIRALRQEINPTVPLLQPEPAKNGHSHLHLPIEVEGVAVERINQ